MCDKGMLRPEIGSMFLGFGVSVGVASQIELVNYWLAVTYARSAKLNSHLAG